MKTVTEILPAHDPTFLQHPASVEVYFRAQRGQKSVNANAGIRFLNALGRRWYAALGPT